MMDTEGSEVHTSALEQPIKAEVRLEGFRVKDLGLVCHGGRWWSRWVRIDDRLG